MNDEELDRQATAFASEHGVSYTEGLRAAQLIEVHGVGADRARMSFAQGIVPSDEQMAAYAEVESIKRRIPMNEALSHAFTEMEHAQGAQRFYSAVQWNAPVGEADLNDAAMMMAAQGTTSYGEALSHLARIVEFGDPFKAIETAFSEGAEITDGMAHAAAMAHMVRTGSDYVRSLHHVIDTLPVPVGAQFMEASGEGGPQAAELEIFRAGTHIDSSGQKHSFSVQDVQNMAASYDPGKREAPMVKGHPEDGAPSYGWISSLRVTEDGRLMARATQWDKGFLNELKEGRYKKRSASFYHPGHPNNPAPGSWYLRHLGWLGAQQPALQGLADAAFHAPGDDVVTFTV